MEFEEQSKWEEIKSYVEAAILARRKEDGEISETRKKVEMIEEVGEATKRDAKRTRKEKTNAEKRKSRQVGEEGRKGKMVQKTEQEWIEEAEALVGRLYEIRGKIATKETKRKYMRKKMGDILQELDGLNSKIEEGVATEQNKRTSLRRANKELELPQDKRDKTTQGKQRKSEITVSKFSEQAVNEMAQSRTGTDRDGWGIHRR